MLWSELWFTGQRIERTREKREGRGVKGRRQEARFSSLELIYIRFLHRLIQRGAMTEEQGVCLLSSELALRSDSSALLPISVGFFRTITSQIGRGCRRIAVWTDDVGKRYITADPPP